jgi:hypothetical protein
MRIFSRSTLGGLDGQADLAPGLWAAPLNIAPDSGKDLLCRSATTSNTRRIRDPIREIESDIENWSSVHRRIPWPGKMPWLEWALNSLRRVYD